MIDKTCYLWRLTVSCLIVIVWSCMSDYVMITLIWWYMMKLYMDVLRLTCWTLKWLGMTKVVHDDFLHELWESSLLCGRLVSLTWYMYEREHEMYWLRMLIPLSIVCMNGIIPWMILRKSFIWNLEPSGKVMNLEVECLNGVLLVMNDRFQVDLMERHHIILRKVIISYRVAIVRQP